MSRIKVKKTISLMDCKAIARQPMDPIHYFYVPYQNRKKKTKSMQNLIFLSPRV